MYSPRLERKLIHTNYKTFIWGKSGLFKARISTDIVSMKKTFLVVILWIMSFVIISCAAKSIKLEQQGRKPSSLNSYVIQFFNPEMLLNEEVTYQEFDLNKDLGTLDAALDKFQQTYKQRRSEEKSGKKIENQFVTAKDLKRPYSEFDLTDKSLRLAVEKMRALISEISEGQDVLANKYQIVQLAKAIEQKYTVPTKVEFEALGFPIYLVRYLNSPSVDNEAKTEDHSPLFLQAQLQNSPPIKGENFFDYLSLNQKPENCVYLKPKTGYGRRAGFQITCNGNNDYKVKFGVELFSGPVNSRLYRAVGYTVPQINYVDDLKMKYDRRMLVEFNKRQMMLFKLRFIGIKVHSFTNKKIFDPFEVIKYFELKDGSLVSSADMKVKLLKDQNAIELSDADFVNSALEDQIKDIHYVPATLTVKNDPVMGEEIGHWSATDLDYRDLKEVRALLVMSAWIGNYDIRKDNLKLTMIGEGKNGQIKMTIGDAGAGLGKGDLGFGGLLSASEINDMKWTVSSRYTVQNNNDRTSQEEREVFTLDGLTIIEPNKGLKKIKISDGQWMLRKMCLITKDQLTQALVASGMSSAEVVLAREKLLFRRNKMLIDFRMSEKEIADCHVPADKKINYDPEVDGLVKINSKSKGEVSAPARGRKIVKGQLVP